MAKRKKMKRFAPRYTILIRYEPFELFTQGEYFVDAAIHAENFSIAGRNSVARPQAGSEFASSWIGPKRSVNFERWPDYDVPGIRFLYSLDSQAIGRTVLTGPILLTSHAKKACERQHAASIRLKSNILSNVRWSNS